MRLPVPGPRDVISALERGGGQVEALLGAVPRVLDLLDRAEALATRAAAAIDRVEAVASDAASVVDRANGVIDQAQAQVERIGPVIDGAQAQVERIGPVIDDAQAQVERIEPVIDRVDALVLRVLPLLDALEPSLTRLQPTLETLAETTHPDEVAALVRLVDHLPELTGRIERDVLPVLTTLGTVAPDMHDLLTVTRELNDMLAKVPGMARIRRRIEEEEGEDRTTASVRD